MKYLLAVCGDNASSCDVLARTVGIILLKRYHLGFHEENGRICCLAHVVNLVVQRILSSLGDADDPEKEDYFLPNKHLPIHCDADQDANVQEMEAHFYTERIDPS
jgi:hypothetical protein